MKWLKRKFRNNSEEIFPQLSMEEKRHAISISPGGWEFILAGRKDSSVEPVNADYITKMTDDDILKAIEISRLSLKAANTSDPRESIRLFKQVVSLAPFDSLSTMSIGVQYAHLGDINNALLYLENAIEMDPNNQQIRTNLEAVKKHFHK